jgi:hypothetical protein
MVAFCELERIEKVVMYLRILSQHSAGETEDNYEKFRIAFVPAWIRTGHLLNRNQKISGSHCGECQDESLLGYSDV